MGLGHATAELGDGDLEVERIARLDDAPETDAIDAGEEPDLAIIETVKQTVTEVPVFLNTGAKKANIREYLQVADGVILGSSLKEAGYTWNKVDPERVSAFMAEVSKGR